MEDDIRERYVHDAACSGDNFEEPNERGLKQCKDCSGVFDEDGKGVLVDDYRFQNPYPRDAH